MVRIRNQPLVSRAFGGEYRSIDIRFGNDLLLDGKRIWLTRASRTNPPIGRLTSITIGRWKEEKVANFPKSDIPHFLTLHEPNKRLFVTTYRLHPKSRLLENSPIYSVERSVEKPIYTSKSLLSGIVALENTLLVADYYAGELLELSTQGEVVHTFRGLEGPMGMERAPNGDICVAEMLGGRIRYFPLNTLRGY